MGHYRWQPPGEDASLAEPLIAEAPRRAQRRILTGIPRLGVLVRARVAGVNLTGRLAVQRVSSLGSCGTGYEHNAPDLGLQADQIQLVTIG
jgi:hypothetical protein